MPYQPTSDDLDVDMGRLPHEIRRALEEQAGTMPDLLTPGLRSRSEPGELVILSNEGEELCRIPAYRLWAVSLRMLAAAVTDVLPTGDADQVVTAIRDGHVETPADRDDVTIRVGPDRELVVHRSACVPGWPESDQGPDWLDAP